MASATCFTFLPRVFPPHNHPTSLCDLEKVSNHLLSVGSPFGKRVPVIEPAPGRTGDACQPCSACAEMEDQGTGRGGDGSRSFLSQMSTVHPLYLQEGFLAVGKGINRMQGICSLRTHSLMEKMVPIEIIEIIVPSDKNNKI